MEAINSYLKGYKVKIVDVKETLPDAHARFSALNTLVIINSSSWLQNIPIS